jgi:tetratricopeptide (TPR) repeat protein
MCYFCWYNFEATSEEQKEIQESESFREKSVNIVACNRLGRLDEALEYDIKAKDFADKHLSNNDDCHGLSFINRGKIFTLKGDMSKGMEYYNLALEFSNRTSTPNPVRLAQIYFNIGEWHELSNQKDLAIEYYERVTELASQQHGRDVLRNLLLLRCTKALNELRKQQ